MPKIAAPIKPTYTETNNMIRQNVITIAFRNLYF